MLTSAHYKRLRKLNLNPSDLLNKKTKAAFELTFADPVERFKVFNQLIDLRVLLVKYGLKSTKDLQAVLDSLNNSDKPDASL